jgi:hypothetical protein
VEISGMCWDFDLVRYDMTFHMGPVPLAVYYVEQYSVANFADMHLHRSNEYLGQVQGVKVCANDAVSSNAVADLPQHPKNTAGYVCTSCLWEG